MHHITPLLEYFDNLLPLSAEEKGFVSEFFKPRHYKKRQYILQEGDVCNHISFVVHGCLRMYKIDLKGNIHILQIPVEPLI